MPRASITVDTYDSQGSVDLDLLSSQEGVGNRRRRTQVVETLDGGVAVSDNGGGVGGIQLQLKSRTTQAQDTILKHIFDTYVTVQLATEDGYFTAAPISLSFSGGIANIILTLITKEA